MVTNPSAANVEYWTDRAERVILSAEKTAEEMLSGLESTYKEAQKSIQREIEAFYGRYATETGMDIATVRQRLSASELSSFQQDAARYYDELKALGGDPAYLTHLRSLSARAYMSRLEEVQTNIQVEIEKVYAQQQQVFHDAMAEAYTESFYQTVYDIQTGIQAYGSFTALNTRAIEKAVAQKWLGENYSSRIWANKDRLTLTLDQLIPQGVALGQNPRVIGRNIAKELGVSYNNAVRLARTEFNHVANSATFDSYKECGVEQYQVLATLDNRTSEICAHMDSHIFKLSEKMEGVTYPPFHPNCRTTTIPYFEPDEIDEEFETTKPMSFKEWKLIYGNVA